MRYKEDNIRDTFEKRIDEKWLYPKIMMQFYIVEERNSYQVNWFPKTGNTAALPVQIY
jgi:hypothetical protein